MTPSEIKRFYSTYSRRMGVRVVDKSIINFVIRAAYVAAPKRFADLLPKMAGMFRPMAVVNAVVLDFKVGENALASWVYQVKVLVHETTHSRRIREWVKKGGKVSGWYEEYYRNSVFRATEEAVAIAAESEVDYHLTGKRQRVPNMEEYFLGTSGATVFEESFHHHMDVVYERGPGASTCKSALAAIKLLKEMGIEVE